MEDIKLLYVDLFCGAGGTSTGVERAEVNGAKCAKVVACVNHDANAIASHAANHPGALHFTEDIRIMDLTRLVVWVERMRIVYPGALLVLWASLECTNFSKAKGGLPRDADSRTLADHLFRYVDELGPDYIQIENVEEFMSWGEMDDNGKPISRDKGREYQRWKGEMMGRGYDFRHRLLNSADYGAYTSRKRFFGIFAKEGLPIVFPEPTHRKGGDKGMFGNLERWRAVREVLDFSDEGVTIFREKPISERTLERIYAGLVKFVAGGKREFMVKYNSMGQNGRYNAPGVDDPCPVVSCQGRLAVVQTSFLSKYYSGHPESKNISVEGPAGAVTCKDSHAFVSVYYGKGFNGGTDEPAPTLTTKDRISVINPVFVDQQYGNGKPASVEAPLGCVTTVPKYNVVSCKPWVMNTNYRNTGSSADSPAPVITANRKQYYLMNPQFASKGGSVGDPCFTLIARMDKASPYLVMAEDGEAAIIVYGDDSPATIRIKEFMAMYGIVDIKMRMLKIPELKRIMGFPDSYVLKGNQTEQKKQIGNAVETNMARVLCEALAGSLAACGTKKRLA